MKTVLITGGAGFLGIYLARYLLKKGFKIICLDITNIADEKIKSQVIFIHGDIKNRKQIQRAFKNVDYVIHTAAALPILHDKKAIFDTNVKGTKNVLEESYRNKIKRFIFISSTAVYGVPKHLPETETDTLDPIGYYGESKVEGEKLCLEYFKRGLSLNIIRPKTFLGPERLGVFTLWFEAIYNSRSVFILGRGKNLYQLLDVNDLCNEIYNALIVKTEGQIFNGGAEIYGTWEHDLGALIRHAKSKSKIVGFPVLPSQLALSLLEKLNLSPIVAWHYRTLPIDSYVAIDKAKKLLSFNPKKSNQDILKESYDWYAKNRKKFLKKTGTTHRTVWNFKLIDFISKFV